MVYPDDDFDDPVYAEDDGEENLTLPCPEYGREVFEDADQCPHCGAWITPLTARRGAAGGWTRLAAIVVIAAMLFWLLRSLLR